MRQYVWLRKIIFMDAVVGMAVTGGTLSQGQQVSTAARPETQVMTRVGNHIDIAPRPLSVALSQGKEPFTLINVHIPYEGEIYGTDAFIPFDVIANRSGALPADKGAPIVLYCMSGRMSEIAATTLVKLGHTNVKNLSGGMVAWRNAGLPLVRHPKATGP